MRRRAPFPILLAMTSELVARTGVLDKSLSRCTAGCTTKVRSLELEELLSRKNAEPESDKDEARTSTERSGWSAATLGELVSHAADEGRTVTET